MLLSRTKSRFTVEVRQNLVKQRDETHQTKTITTKTSALKYSPLRSLFRSLCHSRWRRLQADETGMSEGALQLRKSGPR